MTDLISRPDVACIVCNDGSTDGTAELIKNNYPNIQFIENKVSKGLIYSRNRLLALVKGKYAISLDDDAHFITEKPLEFIEDYFKNHLKCGVIAFRIYWGKVTPSNLRTNEKRGRVKGFVGCGHVWNMKAWQAIPNYTDWFIFYGEEDFAAFQLFKAGWEVHYVPHILVHHRVDIKARKKDKDYRLRLRRSLRSGWYLYVLFFPWQEIPKRFAYTLWQQIKLKVFKGDWKALLAIIQALGDIIINIPRLLKNANRLTLQEFKQFQQLSDTKLYWNPEE